MGSSSDRPGLLQELLALAHCHPHLQCQLRAPCSVGSRPQAPNRGSGGWGPSGFVRAFCRSCSGSSGPGLAWEAGEGGRGRGE